MGVDPDARRRPNATVCGFGDDRDFVAEILITVCAPQGIPFRPSPSGSRPPPALGILNCSDWLCFGARRGYCCGTYDYTGGYCRGRTARATFGPMRAVCASRPTGTKFVAVGRETRPGGRASAVGGRLAGA